MTVVVTEQDTSIVVVSGGEQGPQGPQGLPGTVIGNTTIDIEAGEDLTIGDPVYVLNNKAYLADNVTNYKVIGIVQIAAQQTFMSTIVLNGSIQITGLSVGSPYYLGNKQITNIVPTSSYIVRLGTAIKSDILVVNIEEPILLS